METSTLVALAIGAVALFLGRRLLWLVVAVAGFLVGFLLLPELIPAVDDWSQGVRIGVGVALGLLLAIVARTLTKFGAAILGFIFASTFAVPIVNGLELTQDIGDQTRLIVAVGTGLLGALIAYLLVDPAIIVLTSVWGATQMMRTASEQWELDPGWYGLILAGLVALGLFVQFRSKG